MKNPGIIRSKVKINSAIINARAHLAMREAGNDFSTWVWTFTGGKPIQNHWRAQEDVPAVTPLAEEMSKALKDKGFKFLSPTRLTRHPHV